MTSKQANKWIAIKVRQEMKARRMKKVQLALLMKVSPPYITKLLSGRENLTFETCEKLANCLGMKFQVNLVF